MARLHYRSNTVSNVTWVNFYTERGKVQDDAGRSSETLCESVCIETMVRKFHGEWNGSLGRRELHVDGTWWRPYMAGRGLPDRYVIRSSRGRYYGSPGQGLVSRKRARVYTMPEVRELAGKYIDDGALTLEPAP